MMSEEGYTKCRGRGVEMGNNGASVLGTSASSARGGSEQRTACAAPTRRTFGNVIRGAAKPRKKRDGTIDHGLTMRKETEMKRKPTIGRRGTRTS
jgi:hypothetical protein